MRIPCQNGFVTVLEAAEELGVPHHWIYRMCARGQLEGTRINGRDVICRDSIDAEKARLTKARRVMRLYAA